MDIILEESFSLALLDILHYIAKDKKSAAVKFRHNLQKKIHLLKQSPFMCKQSLYFSDESYRDLTYLGYTIVYKVDHDNIKVLDVFKYENR